MAAHAISTSWRSFWHAVTSYDRHASHDSPYRTGQHVPLPQSRHAPLTSVATSAIESRHDLSSPYMHDDPATSNGYVGSPSGHMSPRSPYSPGLRSASMNRTQSNEDTNAPNVDPKKKVHRDGIQMRDFSDGLPPPPPVAHSWKRIDRWAEDRYEELYDNLCEGCTQNDVNELEHELDCTLPLDVRESLQVHDGQERGGLPTGIIFGCMLLDCEEIVEEWSNWRRVNEDLQSQGKNSSTVFRSTPQPPGKAFGGVEASSSTSPPPPQGTQSPNPTWRQDLLARQDSQPPYAVQKAYAHPAWIPLVRDWGGNCLAVDLAPGSAGRWGQVVLFGRDYDCKYVVARSWAHLLAALADDLNSEHVHIDDDSGDLRLRQFRRQNLDPPYLEILRWRTDQKCGGRRAPASARPGPPSRPISAPNGLRINSNVGGGGGGGAPPVGNGGGAAGSPYSSPVLEDRRGRSPSRSPSRFPSRGPGSGTNSPRTGVSAHVSSPLARVAEEAPAPVRVHTSNLGPAGGGGASGKLLSIDTPVEGEVPRLLGEPLQDDGAGEEGKGAEADKENRGIGEGKEGMLREVTI